MQKLLSALFAILIAGGVCLAFAPDKPKMNLKITHIQKDFPISELNNAAWNSGKDVLTDKYWSSEKAPAGRHFKTRLLWSANALYVRFEANQAEPLVVSETPNLTSKTRGLWDRDVCEIFIAPNPKEFRKYFEFEVAPTGEWIDLGIHQMPDKRQTDWDYKSGMESAARIEKERVVMAIKIPFSSLGSAPKAGDKWMGNILRCVGEGETRGYLTWSPTKTPQPNFHKPEMFGEFVFTK